MRQLVARAAMRSARPAKARLSRHRHSVPCTCVIPVETLGEALAEGINTGHPAMPEFVLDPDQIHDLLSHLKTLE
jgi:hypothetical protein